MSPDLIDRGQGIAHMKGVPRRLTAMPDAEVRALKTQFGPTDRLPPGPEGRMAPSRVRAGDFMADDVSGDGVEFEAMRAGLAWPQFSLRTPTTRPRSATCNQ